MNKRARFPLRDPWQVPTESLAWWMGPFGLLLFGFTYPLWTPQTAFPQIPLFPWLVGAPGWIDWLTLAMIFSGLVAISRPVGGRFPVGGQGAVLLGLIVAMLLDQHRLQPWAYQWALWLILLLTLPPRSCRFWIRAIVISIYFYSAISKLDYQFLDTVGPQLLAEACAWLNIDFSTLTDRQQFALTCGLPIAELVAAGLLVVPVPIARRTGVVLLMLMHAGLMLVLSPWGLGHQPAVLIWNAFFLVQVWLLFGPEPVRTPPDRNPTPSTLDDRPDESPAAPIGWHWIGQGIAIFAMLFPLTQPLGGCDHWLAWELYAPRTSRVEIRISYPQQPPLPVENATERPGFTVAEVDLARWSLETLGVPVYPQARFQAGCAWAIREAAERDGNWKLLNCTLQSTANRWTGERQSEQIPGDQLDRLGSMYRLNTRPRFPLQLGKNRPAEESSTPLNGEIPR